MWDAHSPIRVKMLHHQGGAQINTEFFEDKIQRAYALRTELLETNTNSYRLLFGENDGLPACIADVYADVIVLKLYSPIWLPYLKQLIAPLLEVSKAKNLVLRMSRNLQRMDTPGLSDGTILVGELDSEVVEFVEHGVHFSANVIHGHKTGYFLDHRENRRRVGLMSRGKTVLDVFCYAGGFSVYALAGGATEVTSLDISAQALDVAKANAALNSHQGTHTLIAGDAFEKMKELIAAGTTYNVVVIDPPSFAKSQKEVALAEKKYLQLASLGAALTAPKGTLVLASCSSRVSAESFLEINNASLKASGRSWKLSDTTRHDMDHPIGFAEGAYLKCGYYQFLD